MTPTAGELEFIALCAAKAQRAVQRLRELVKKLDECGAQTDAAVQLLRAFEDGWECHLRRQDRLLTRAGPAPAKFVHPN